MIELDHLIIKVNDLDSSVQFYQDIMGFQSKGISGPFAVMRVSENLQLQLAPWGTPGFEHYAFAVSRAEFDDIFARIKANDLDYGPSFDSVGANSGPGVEPGARGDAPTLYFSDPNKHLLEIRTYEPAEE